VNDFVQRLLILRSAGAPFSDSKSGGFPYMLKKLRIVIRVPATDKMTTGTEML
jgi:hypothetical protein